jgi:GT2 family glycosyltransferase
VQAFFEASPGVVGASGRLLADGINSCGISVENGLAMIAAHDRDAPPDIDLSTRAIVGLYGCNMVFRRSAIEGEWFDENLPLYGWQEDVDFARRIERHGRCAAPMPLSACIWAAGAGGSMNAGSAIRKCRTCSI